MNIVIIKNEILNEIYKILGNNICILYPERDREYFDNEKIMKNGVIDKKILNEDPFTNYGGILQLFDGQMNIIQIIIMIIDLINGNGCYKQQNI